jgi:hypothetical protein
MNNDLIIKARNIVNKSNGSSICINSEIIDSDALSFINDDEVYIHFRNRQYKDITLPLLEINDIKFDDFGGMIMVHLFSNDGQVITIHCLP